MDTIEPDRKNKKKWWLSIPVAGAVILIAGVLLTYFLGVHVTPEREDGEKKKFATRRAPAEVIKPAVPVKAIDTATIGSLPWKEGGKDQEEKNGDDEGKEGNEGGLIQKADGATVPKTNGEPKATPAVLTKNFPHQPELVSLGEYKITFYCKCAKCCGKSDGITATGTIATSNRTIAVDPKVIPYGSKVVIDGREYIAEDTGAFKGQTIDMFVDSHQEALNRGVLRKEVFVVRDSR